MLKIRPDQTAQFELDAVERFVRRAVAHLRKELPDRVNAKNDAQLAQWVRDAMARAGPFDLRTEKQIMFFLDAEVLLGPRFYESPEHDWAGKVLTSGKLHPDDKAGVLLATACSFDRERNRK